MTAHAFDGRFAHQVMTCSAKVQYPTRRIAKDAAARATELHGKEFGAYRCDVCGRYHLTTHLRKEES